MNPSAIYDVAEVILDCVCDQMDALADEVETYPGCPCLPYVSAGEPVIDCCTIDCDDGGMLTVHVESVYPSDAFPNPLEGFDPCKAATWVAAVVVTAARCTPTLDEGGNLAATPAELNANAELMALDQYAILTALSCCVVSTPPPGRTKRRLVITETRPLVSEGGCASVEIRALVDIGQVCNCRPATS